MARSILSLFKKLALMQEPISSIEIRETRELLKPKKHTVYIINIRGPVKSWTVTKRYSEFDDLHKKLLDIQTPPCELPRKTLMNFTNEVIKERQEALALYLQTLLYSKDSTWRRSKPWQEFLGLPDTTVVDQINLLSVNQIDPSKWIQEYESLVSFISDIKTFLINKDRFVKGGDTSAAQANKIQAVKGLRQVDEIIGKLEASLNDPSSKNSLSSGEIIRRQDLLDNIKATAKQTQTDASTVSAPPEFNYTAIQSPRSTRKFGVAQETERTRNLNSQELLQLQNQEMKMQDNQLDSLAEIVKRQKEIGLTISNELDAQNTMLEQVDDGVTRVEGTLKTADKKLNRILRG
ncbi:hypothetical protein HDV01_005835 [Terramyces sp. JEL0728]|nr:hypothetical protein HDV01_005835 [Terramyces sp. JEL0728]